MKGTENPSYDLGIRSGIYLSVFIPEFKNTHSHKYKEDGWTQSRDLLRILFEQKTGAFFEIWCFSLKTAQNNQNGGNKFEINRLK